MGKDYPTIEYRPDMDPEAPYRLRLYPADCIHSITRDDVSALIVSACRALESERTAGTTVQHAAIVGTIGTRACDRCGSLIPVIPNAMILCNCEVLQGTVSFTVTWKDGR